MGKYLIASVLFLTLTELRGQVIFSGISGPAMVKDVQSFNARSASVETIVNGKRIDGSDHGIFQVPKGTGHASNSVYDQRPQYQLSTESIRDSWTSTGNPHNADPYNHRPPIEGKYQHVNGPVVVNGAHIKGPLVIDGSKPGTTWSYHRTGTQWSSTTPSTQRDSSGRWQQSPTRW